jgi:hypothetical protein
VVVEAEAEAVLSETSTAGARQRIEVDQRDDDNNAQHDQLDRKRQQNRVRFFGLAYAIYERLLKHIFLSSEPELLKPSGGLLLYATLSKNPNPAL